MLNPVYLFQDQLASFFMLIVNDFDGEVFRELELFLSLCKNYVSQVATESSQVKDSLEDGPLVEDILNLKSCSVPFWFKDKKPKKERHRSVEVTR